MRQPLFFKERKDMKFTKGSYLNTLPCGNQCSQECFADVSKSSVTDYIALLLENGYAQQEISTPNGNIFTTLTSKDELIHLSYFKHDNTLKILRDPLLETVYKTAEPQYKKITNTTLAPSSAGIGKMLNTARFIAKSGSSNKKYDNPY